MRNVIAQRAGAALDGSYSGPHRDKRIARDFGVSVRMAQYLRAGQHWTTERLAQASALFGAAFDGALFSPSATPQHFTELGDIANRLTRLEAHLEEVARRDETRSAPPQGEPADCRGGVARETDAPACRRGARS
jgi:hypothetical protein